jgi:hypothetical protein
MNLENFRYTFYPLGTQIAISYVASRHTKLHSQIGFLTSLLLVNLPIAIIALIYRVVGHDWALFMEMWLNCATILQCSFYYSFENNIMLSSGSYIVLFVVYMNEATFYGGNWFGHQVITFTCVFMLLKIFTSVCTSSQKVWAGLIMMEFCTMCALPLVFLWTVPTAEWFIPIFLVSVPLAYPTCNAEIAPNKPQKGLIYIAPNIQFQLLENVEKEE